MSVDAIVEILRAAVLAADPRIAEGVKWNSPSFHVAGAHFATFYLRGKSGLQLIMHLGAKARPEATVQSSVSDTMKLLEWKSPDRAIILVRDEADAKAKGAAITAIAREWMQHV